MPVYPDNKYPNTMLCKDIQRIKANINITLEQIAPHPHFLQ